MRKLTCCFLFLISLPQLTKGDDQDIQFVSARARPRYCEPFQTVPVPCPTPPTAAAPAPKTAEKPQAATPYVGEKPASPKTPSISGMLYQQHTPGLIHYTAAAKQPEQVEWIRKPDFQAGFEIIERKQAAMKYRYKDLVVDKGQRTIKEMKISSTGKVESYGTFDLCSTMLLGENPSDEEVKAFFETFEINMGIYAIREQFCQERTFYRCAPSCAPVCSASRASVVREQTSVMGDLRLMYAGCFINKVKQEIHCGFQFPVHEEEEWARVKLSNRLETLRGTRSIALIKVWQILGDPRACGMRDHDTLSYGDFGAAPCNDCGQVQHRSGCYSGQTGVPWGNGWGNGTVNVFVLPNGTQLPAFLQTPTPAATPQGRSVLSPTPAQPPANPAVP